MEIKLPKYISFKEINDEWDKYHEGRVEHYRFHPSSNKINFHIENEIVATYDKILNTLAIPEEGLPFMKEVLSYIEERIMLKKIVTEALKIPNEGEK